MPLLNRTERLVLRELVPGDTGAIHSIFGEPDVVRFTEWDVFRSEADAAWLVRWAISAAEQEPRFVYAFALVLAAPEQAETVLGVATLSLRDARRQDAVLGFILGKPWWGQGVATGAARALLAFGFGTLDLHRIHANCRPENLRSAHVLEKLGMQREAHLRQNKWEKNAWHDTLVYAILRSEWNSEAK